MAQADATGLPSENDPRIFCDMTTTLMTRRQFGKAILRLLFYSGVGLTAFEAEQGGYDPVLTFIRLGLHISSPEDVASTFVRSDSAFLMASYAVFFPELLRRNGFGSIQALQLAASEQKKIYTKDHHRLDALPAVAAAHLMPSTKDATTRHQLSQSILRGLDDSRREVREIILQNLATSVAPNFDSVRYFSIEPAVISRIRGIIEEASDVEKLMPAALQCTEFLLNARALLLARNASMKELRPYNEAIEFARHINASHVWYVPKLVQLHEATFKASISDTTSLPPQSSEALMGWRNFPQAREYFSLLAIARARLIYTELLTACGKLKSDSVMSSDEAKRALPKIASFFTTFELDRLYRESSVSDLVSVRERKFAAFLKSEFEELIVRPDRFGIPVDEASISAEMVKLRDYVPFAQFGDRGLLCRALRERDERFRKGVLEGIVVSGSTISLEGLAALIPWISGRKALVAAPPKSELVEQARAEVGVREMAIDAGQYEGLDQQQISLGDIDTSKLSVS
jgi:hypothetical protein